jgi:hypothetical protein
MGVLRYNNNIIKTEDGVITKYRPYKPFIFSIDTTQSGGSTKSGGIHLLSSYDYNFFIDWGNGYTEYVDNTKVSSLTTVGDTKLLSHEYSVEGIYDIKISGIFGGIYSNNSTYKNKIIGIKQWGDIIWDDAIAAFRGCINLNITATDIPQWQNVVSFNNTFNGCSSLTNIHKHLFSKAINVTNFASTFGNCINVTTIDSELFVKNIKINTFANAFRGCSKLNNIPFGLFDKTILVNTFNNTFRDCINITSIPNNLFSNTPLVTTFNGCFYNNRIIELPLNLFVNNTQVTNFGGCFYGNNITSIPSNLFSNTPLVTSFGGCFYGNNITSIPSNLFNNNTQVTLFADTFGNCINLTEIPSNLFNNNIKVESFFAVFYNCTSLQAVPYDLITPQKHPYVTDFRYAFNNLVSVTGESPSIWKDWLNGQGDGYSGKVSMNTTLCFTGSIGFTDFDNIPSTWK